MGDGQNYNLGGLSLFMSWGKEALYSTTLLLVFLSTRNYNSTEYSEERNLHFSFCSATKHIPRAALHERRDLFARNNAISRICKESNWITRDKSAKSPLHPVPIIPEKGKERISKSRRRIEWSQVDKAMQC